MRQDTATALSTQEHETTTSRPQSRRGDAKARHVLGLAKDSIPSAPIRTDSASTISSLAKRPQSVKFSSTTTVLELDHPRKDSPTRSSRVVSDTTSTPRLPRIRSFASTNSLSSFYEKKRAPHVAVEQPSQPVATKLNNDKSFRLFSRNSKRRQSSNNVSSTSSAWESSPASYSSFLNDEFSVAQSMSPSASASRISITRPKYEARSSTPDIKVQQPSLAPIPAKNRAEDAARAKINVRRPKPGTKEWFDDVDSESSEEDVPIPPRMLASPRPETVDLLRLVRPKSAATNFSRRPGHGMKLIRSASAQQHSRLHSIEESSSAADLGRTNNWYTKIPVKTNPLDVYDLTQHSVLDLSGSEEEEGPLTPRDLESMGPRVQLRASLLEGLTRDSDVEIGKALAIERNYSLEPSSRPRTVQTSNSGTARQHRTQAYEQLDHSDEIFDDELLSAFPRTPSDSRSKRTSYRDSMISTAESVASTRLVPITRQEENLIAAMRMKKSAMKRTQALTRRQEQDTVAPRSISSISQSRRRQYIGIPARGIASSLSNYSVPPSRIGQFESGVLSRATSRGSEYEYRPTSISTAMTEDVHYLSHKAQADEPVEAEATNEAKRETFLSDTTTESVDTNDSNHWSTSVGEGSMEHEMEVRPKNEIDVSRAAWEVEEEDERTATLSSS